MFTTAQSTNYNGFIFVIIRKISLWGNPNIAKFEFIRIYNFDSILCWSRKTISNSSIGRILNDLSVFEVMIVCQYIIVRCTNTRLNVSVNRSCWNDYLSIWISRPSIFYIDLGYCVFWLNCSKSVKTKTYISNINSIDSSFSIFWSIM